MIALTPSDGLARLHWEAIKGFLEKLKGGTELGKLQLAVADLLGPQYDLGKVIMAEPLELARIATVFDLQVQKENANGRDYKLNYSRIEKTYFLLSSIKKSKFWVFF